MKLILKKVKDKDILWLIEEIVGSYSSSECNESRSSLLSSRLCSNRKDKGIPLGNLTSQIFANVYLNELDQFVKHRLRIKYYLRYADDFIILSSNQPHLLLCFETVKQLLEEKLQLQLHPKKIFLRKLFWGIDFCGYVVLPHYILPRLKTKRRIVKKIIKSEVTNQALQSYLGYFCHASSFKIIQNVKNLYFFKT